jgi:hypothetical protein
MKIAYLILAHAQPQQLGRLVHRLDSPDARFYIHIDANTPETTFTAMQAAAPQACWIPRQPCRWGGFSLVDASLRLIEAALADGCDWLVLLSGQDYPLKHPDEIARTLAASPFAAHLDIQPDFAVGYRWQYWHFEKINGTLAGKIVQKVQRLCAPLGLSRKLPAVLPHIRAGSQWWMLSAPLARELIRFIQQNPPLIAFFRHTLVPDEMFFQSIISSLYPPEKIGPSLRQIEWQTGSWSPRTFEQQDAGRLIGSPALFARKFGADGLATAAIDRLLDR